MAFYITRNPFYFIPIEDEIALSMQIGMGIVRTYLSFGFTALRKIWKKLRKHNKKQ
jgi:hypothetical protein